MQACAIATGVPSYRTAVSETEEFPSADWHDRFGAVRRIVDRSPSAGRQIDLEMIPGLVNAGVYLADAGRIVVSRCVVEGEHVLDVLQETVVVLRFGPAPLEFAQRVETRKKHVLEHGFVLDILRPEVRLDAR